MIEFTITPAICIPLLMILAQTDQILDRGDDSSPRAVADQKNPGQTGLRQ